MKELLALDLSTVRVGWTLGAPDCETPRFGGFEPPKDAEPGRKLTKIREWLVGMLQVNDVAYIAYESQFIGANATTGMVLVQLGGVVEQVADQFGVPIGTVAISSWKKELTGHGTASKPDVMAVIKGRGWVPKSQDEADALGVWLYAVKCKAPRVYRERWDRRLFGGLMK